MVYFKQRYRRHKKDPNWTSRDENQNVQNNTGWVQQFLDTRRKDSDFEVITIEAMSKETLREKKTKNKNKQNWWVVGQLRYNICVIVISEGGGKMKNTQKNVKK